jgi:glycine cleavage system H protein
MDPNTLRYAKTHEWAHVEGNVVTIGISKFAADQLTDITYIDLPDVGDHVFKGQDFSNIETVKAVSDVYAPIDGEVIAVNERLEEDPNLITRDPYGEGWMIKIRVEKPSADLGHMLTAAEYAKQVESEPH